MHLGPEEGLGAVPSGSAGEEAATVTAQLPGEGGELSSPGVGGGVVPSAMLPKEVRKRWVVNFTLKRKKVIVGAGKLQIFTRTCVFTAWLFLSVPGLWTLTRFSRCCQNSDLL